MTQMPSATQIHADFVAEIYWLKYNLLLLDLRNERIFNNQIKKSS